MKIPLTKQQEIDNLRLGCEQCLSHLNEIANIHIELDPATRVIRPNDDEIVYRLRKVLLHVKAILHVRAVAGWQFDTTIMHVLAPELRAAKEQIDILWKKMPDEQLKALVQCSPLLRGEQILSSYIHPTPQNLYLPRERGGLGPVDEVRYYIHLLLSLKKAVDEYALSVYLLSKLLNGGEESQTTSQIISVIHEARKWFDSMSPADYLRFVSREESGIDENVSGPEQ